MGLRPNEATAYRWIYFWRTSKHSGKRIFTSKRVLKGGPDEWMDGQDFHVVQPYKLNITTKEQREKKHLRDLEAQQEQKESGQQ